MAEWRVAEARWARLSSWHAPVLEGVGEDLRVKPGQFVEPVQADASSPVLFAKIIRFPAW
jgi:hypothetical protein